jgi:hypothetical protein
LIIQRFSIVGVSRGQLCGPNQTKREDQKDSFGVRRGRRGGRIFGRSGAAEAAPWPKFEGNSAGVVERGRVNDHAQDLGSDQFQ